MTLCANDTVMRVKAERTAFQNLSLEQRERIQSSFVATVESSPSASGFDRLAPNSPHSSAPAKPLAEGPPSRARGNDYHKANAAILPR
jgi:hypothetical protein